MRQKGCGYILLLIILALGWHTPSYANGQLTPENINFRHLNLSQYTSDQSHVGFIQYIAQDRHGFMWFGGEGGLVRFDGHQIKMFSDTGKSDGPLGQYIRNIAFDHQHRMWVSTTRGLSRFNETTEQFTHYAYDPENKAGIAGLDVSSLAMFDENTMVVGTTSGLSLLDIKTNTFQNYFHDPLDPNSLSSNAIETVTVDRNGVIWAGTHHGLNAINVKSNTITRYDHHPHKPNSLRSDDIISLLEDQHQKLWVGTLGGGLSYIDKQRKVIRHFHEANGVDISKAAINHITETKDGYILAAMDHFGILVIPPNSQDSFIIQHDRTHFTSLDSNQPRFIFEDNRGDIWISTFTGIINYLNRQTTLFTHYQQQTETRPGFDNKTVLTIIEARDGSIWAGTEGGLTKFNPKDKTFVNYIPEPGVPKKLQGGGVLAVAEEKDGTLWIGTWAAGLHKFYPDTETFEHFTAEHGLPGGSKGIHVWDILIDDYNNNVWIGTQRAGLVRYNRGTETFTSYDRQDNNPHSLSWGFVRDMTLSQDGKLWVSTIRGLNIYNAQEENFTRITPDSKNSMGINSDRILAVMQHSNQSIWVATEDEGIYLLMPNTSQFTSINASHGLPSLKVSSLLEDNDGYVWAATINGLSKIDPRNIHDIKTYKTHHGLNGHYFNRDSLLLTQAGDIYVGNNRGMSIFNPQQLAIETHKSLVNITTIDFHNESTDKKEKLMIDGIHTTKSINLKHTQNAFSIAFSLPNFRAPELTEYAYRLIGYDSSWRNIGKEYRAHYTNLSPGNYTFQVKAMDLDKHWTPEPTQLKIRIAAPAWQTPWAYGLYIIISFCSLYFIYVTRINKIQLEKQKELNKELIDLDEIRNSFIANTTHELRTPLNGIMGIADSLIRGSAGQQSEENLYFLDIISTSSKRLSSLVNDILDSSKIQANQLDLIKTRVDLHQLTCDCFYIVKNLIGEKNITLNHFIPPGFPAIEADENRLQQIFINLLSNAIKYCDEGSVNVSVSIKMDAIEIAVSDTGIGIPEGKRDIIFEPYQQIENAGSRRSGGTGLGLPLTKKLVELHGGSISVKSIEGKGSTFTVTLPYQSSDDRISQNSSEKTRFEWLKKHVLIVDDDAVNRIVLRNILTSEGATFCEAPSGEKALQEIKQGTFDVIILDINMPDINGFSLCETLRKQYHINVPIIFLSGNTSQKEHNECQQAGGQCLLGKPITRDKLISIDI